MKSKKLLSLALGTVLVTTSLFTGCSKPTSTGEVKETVKEVADPVEKKDIKFYGKIVEYSSGELMTDKLQELLKDKYDIEALQVDWGNLDTVIRTGIASGDPSDVYQYWPQQMRTLVDSEMALDLTPYLEANGAEWKSSFFESALSTGIVDGKYYAVPINSNFSLMIANKAILDEVGISVPEQCTWEEFLATCEKLKAAGLFPMGQNTDNKQGDWFIRNGLLSAGKSEGKLEALQTGGIAVKDPLFTKVFTNVKGLYDNQYMYPGKGAVTVKRDEIKAGFYQGKIAIIGDIASGVGATIQDAPFETVLLPWPSMGDQNAVLGGCDGVFIPANVKDPEAAVEVLKVYTGIEVQQIHADAGFPIVNKNVTISDPVTQSIVSLGNDVYPFEFQTLDPKIDDYMCNKALAEIVLGGGVESTQKALEGLIAQIVK